jgi:hypothetical protein
MQVYGLTDSEIHKLRDGEYTKTIQGNWYCRPPGSYIGNLSQHKVVEHSDKTITVWPSILITCGTISWHGYLTNGNWRTC